MQLNTNIKLPLKETNNDYRDIHANPNPKKTTVSLFQTKTNYRSNPLAASNQLTASVPSARLPGEGKLKTEEQLQQEAMLQGLEQMTSKLQGIKTAVEEQAKKALL